ncbi:chromosome segregation protein SMC [Luteolibacter sp. GHJ8]|uniref:Chromosome partition protein Smc n=1 Tax=Luteolibacter rhizosphaerae TaxID=2989719 RepID=A0ABT3G998_9BACT|nr:chromosome segregation protein SMC [Luteolibacter rhizosphaerae]MCW1916066.1 chromosome segregation protein SMC [Luteolibacter rhizosphaerae]
MYLKSLDIHGFKSFADKTKIEFHKGVTGIVGPNGCGKSNVVDAIRWVLGETSAKALRGGEMADVIFNGTERRKPLGMAEVTLTMADCEEALKVDYNEVSLTRRVFRDGKSEYRINGTLCRLKDIHDLLMDTGIGRTAYSIMAQGQIDQILSSKPEERRAVFEEAAGITKYKREKKEALRKLEFTEANLLRVSDVLAEQERRMNSLKRQVAKARRYQALAGDVRILDTHLGHKKFVEFSAERDELKTSIRSLEATEAELERLMAPKEEAVADARFNARNFEGELADLRQQLNSHRNQLSAAQGRVAFNEERKAELEGRISQNREEIESTREKLAQQEFDVVAANEALEQLARRIAEQEIQLGDQEERTRMARADREQIETQLREARAEANRAQTIIASTQARIESSLAQLETSRERARMLADEEQRLNLEIEEANEQRNRIATELDEHAARTTELEEAFQKAERGYQHTRGDLDAARTAAAEAHKVLAQRDSRLRVVKQLVASGEGFQKGTRKVLDGLDDAERFKPGIHGVLANFIEADRSCARAIETALGRNLQAVLVSDEKLADAIISRLTEKRLGQAAILPETFVGHNGGTQMEALPEGAVGWALDKVKSDPRVARVIERLLDKVLIVPNYATAMRLRTSFPDVNMVTQAGEVVGAEGIIHGGDAGEGNVSVLELQNEVRDLEKEVAGLVDAEAAARQRVSDLEASLAQLQEEMEVSRERIQRHKVELSTLQGQLTLASREVESVQTKLDNVRWERGELDAREQAAHDSRSGLESELAMARERLEGHEEDQRRLQSQVEGSQRDEAELFETLNELRTSLAVERQAKQAAEAQQQPMEARLSELRELSIRRETEIESFVQRIESAAAENARLAEEVETHQAEAEDLAVEIESRSARRNELIEAIDKAEAGLSESRRRHAKAAEQRGREEVAITKIELRLESLVTTILERHQVELATFEPDAHALLSCIASQKSQQARGGRQTFVESESEGEGEEDEQPIIVVDASKGEDDIELPPQMTGEPDWSFVEAIVGDLKRRLDSMGPVNVDAIEEYEELEERYNEVRSNYDDLVSSKANLIEVIEKINDETQRRFAETFAQVKINFRDMFKELFGEQGKADLMLVDESDPLESGIEVIAKPPGKKLQSISLLSGGERSMTAVALLFSIYMIKPSPFCVLDELDAPLDESNINRFVKVLDRFIDNSQFIIVTHSKRTMARADVMYGVTMEEFGVSKPVGMRLTSADDMAGKGEAKTAAQKAALRLDA